jgi:protease-4
MSPARKPPLPPKRPRRMGCFSRMAIALMVVIIAVVAFRLLYPTYGDKLHGLLGLEQDEAQGIDEFPKLKEIHAYGSGSNKVVIVSVKGVIRFRDGVGPNGGGSAGQALQAIQAATRDDEVQALLVDIDSPGGGVTASDVLYNALRQFRLSRDDRRIVAICGDMAASGGYYTAIAADHIIVRPTTMLGSIGVFWPRVNIYAMGEKIGMQDATIRSDDNKDVNNPLRPPDPLRDVAIQKMVDTLHKRFATLVADRRRLPSIQLAEIADGSIFGADESVQLGLADQVGYWDDALDRCAEMLGVDRVIVYRYEAPFSLKSIFSTLGRATVQGAVSAAPQSHPQFRWQP